MSFFTGTQAEAYYSLASAVGTIGPSATALAISAQNTAPRCILPVGFFNYLAAAGKSLHGIARGTYTSSAATPPTFTATLGMNTTGGTMANPLVTWASTVQPAASITAGWVLEFDVVCSNASATTLTLQTNSRFELSCVAQNTTTPVPATLATLPAIQHGNSKVSNLNAETQYILELGALQSAATAGNSFNVQQFVVMGLN